MVAFLGDEMAKVVGILPRGRQKGISMAADGLVVGRAKDMTSNAIGLILLECSCFSIRMSFNFKHKLYHRARNGVPRNIICGSRVNTLKTARIKQNRERCTSCILTEFQSTMPGLRVYMCVHCAFASLISFRNHVWYLVANLNLNVKWLINWWTWWKGIHLHKIIEPRESIYISPTHLWHIWMLFVITKYVLPIHISSYFQPICFVV